MFLKIGNCCYDRRRYGVFTQFVVGKDFGEVGREEAEPGPNRRG